MKNLENASPIYDALTTNVEKFSRDTCVLSLCSKRGVAWINPPFPCVKTFHGNLWAR